MRKLLAFLACAGLASAGTLRGVYVTPTLGPLVNGTLTLSLSQAAVMPGSYAIVPQTVNCYTSTDGTVVGLPNPAMAPAGSGFAGVGTLPAGAYYIKVSFTGPGFTETLASPEAELSLGAAGELQIAAPALQPPGATGYNVYIGPTPGTEKLQGAAAPGVAFTQASALAGATPPPVNNSTVCGLVFNDATIPTNTYYQASITDAAGNPVLGPQGWYLAGSSVDVSEIVPLASNPGVRFPFPLLANPASGAPQSVGSPLNMNGFGIGASANLGPGMYGQFWAGNLPAANTTLGQWTPNAGVIVRRANLNAQAAGAGGTLGVTLTVSDGANTCTFAHLLVGAASAGSNGAPTGVCTFAAGIPLTVKLTGDDHGSAPANLNWAFETTSQ